MKRIALILTLCVLILCIAACGKNVEPEMADTEQTENVTLLETESDAASEQDVVTEPSAEEPIQPEVTVTEVKKIITAEKVDSFVPYTTQLSANASIYSEPTRESAYVRPVAAAGTYTIVEEATDSAGNLWGKLKSGAGWVILDVYITSDTPVCSRCGTTADYEFAEDWAPGDLCFTCLRWDFHYGEDGGLFCSQCYRDCSYLGLMEDGRCEFCHEED